MKNLITCTIIAATVLGTSCQKSSSSSNTSTTSTASCIANDTAFTFTPNLLQKYIGTPTFYFLDLVSMDHVVNLGFNSDTITVKTYNGGPASSIASNSFINGIAYASNDNSTITITVTSVHNGLADGTFSGNMHEPNGGTKTLKITQGVFKNVPITIAQ